MFVNNNKSRAANRLTRLAIGFSLLALVASLLPAPASAKGGGASMGLKLGVHKNLIKNLSGEAKADAYMWGLFENDRDTFGNAVKEAAANFKSAVKDANKNFRDAKKNARDKFKDAMKSASSQQERIAALKAYYADILAAFRAKSAAIEAAFTAFSEARFNLAPTANNQSVTVQKNSSLSITLTGSDPERSPITYAIVNSPSHGVLSGTIPNLTYTPTAEFTGSDHFMFTVSDGVSVSQKAKVSITVNP